MRKAPKKTPLQYISEAIRTERPYADLEKLIDKHFPHNQFSNTVLTNIGTMAATDLPMAVQYVKLALLYDHVNSESTKYVHASSKALPYVGAFMVSILSQIYPESKTSLESWPTLASLKNEDIIPTLESMYENSYTGTPLFQLVSFFSSIRHGGVGFAIDPRLSLATFSYGCQLLPSINHSGYTIREDELSSLYTRLNMDVNVRDSQGNNLLHAASSLIARDKMSIRNFTSTFLDLILSKGIEDSSNKFGTRGVDELLRYSERLNARPALMSLFQESFPSALPEFPNKDTHPLAVEATRLDILGKSSMARALRTAIVYPPAIGTTQSSTLEQMWHTRMEQGDDISELLRAWCLTAKAGGYTDRYGVNLYHSCYATPNLELRSKHVLAIILHNETCRDELLHAIHQRPGSVRDHRLSHEVRDYLVSYLTSKGVANPEWINAGFSPEAQQLELGL